MRVSIRRVALATCCAAVAWASAPLIASAHALLVESTPADGARLAASPPGICLVFSEGVAPGPTISISGPGRPVALAPPARATAGDAVTDTIPALGDGVYVVSWQVVSSADGHASAGTFSFSVGAGGQALPSSTSSTPVAWLEAVLQALLLVSLAAALGVLAIGLPAPSRVERRGVLVVALGVSQVAALALVAVLVVRLRPAAPAGGGIWGPLFSTSAGVAEVLTVLLLLAVSVAAALRHDRVALLLLLGAAAAVALRAHPSALTNAVVDLVVVLHVAVALLWAGALFHLGVVALRERRGAHPPGQPGRLLARYLRVAPAAVGGVVLSGAVLAGVELRSPGALVSSGYGQVLLVKSVLVGAAIVAALAGRRRLITPTPEGPTAPVRREAVALVGVLGAAALLSAVAPPSPTLATASTAIPEVAVPTSPIHVHEAAFAGDMAVYLTANPTSMVLYIRNFDYQPDRRPPPARSSRQADG